jgi:UrcA family protein
MTRILAAAAAALALAAAPLTASAQAVRVDLSRFDLTTQSGTDRAWAAITEAAYEYCGPIEMPQPLVLRSVRVTCHAGVMSQGARAIEAARSDQLAGLPPRALALL